MVVSCNTTFVWGSGWARCNIPKDSKGLPPGSPQLCQSGAWQQSKTVQWLEQCHATYVVGDLVRVKSYPRCDAQSNFTAKLASLFIGLLCVSLKLGNVIYRRARLDTVDAGFFHVVNLEPFHSWAAGQNDLEAMDSDVPTTQTDNHTDVTAVDMCYDMLSGNNPVSVRDCGDHSTMAVSDLNPGLTGQYELRPRHGLRITSGWSGSRWTNY